MVWPLLMYCDFSVQNMQSASTVLGSVLRQVVGAFAEIPDDTQQAFERAKRQSTRNGYRVKLLLERKGVNPDSSDNKGRTPLSYAASIGAEYAVKLLLEREGVNPNSPDSEGRTPLLYAIQRGSKRVVRLLKRVGATPH